MPEFKSLILFGVDFRSASIAVRESASLDRRRSVELLGELRRQAPGLEGAVLSTCNRTELYLAAALDERSIERRLRASTFAGRLAPLTASVHRGYRARGTSVVRHLCRVACGLESSVLGDIQILGQVKAAMRTAAGSGVLGGTLHEAFTRAMRAGRRARSTTTISRGAASVGAALVGMLAQRHQGAVGEARVLIVGAGKIARQVTRHLAKRGWKHLTIVNRTDERARQVAGECAGRAEPWDRLEALLGDADVVVAAVRSAQPVLGAQTLARTLAGRAERPLLVVDAGVPRNVDPPDGLQVLTVDSILERHQEGLAERRAAVPAVERIVEAEVTRWEQWSAAQPLEHAIKQLFADVRRVSRYEADRLAGLAGITPFEAEATLVRGFKRHLHEYVRALRAPGRRPECFGPR